MPIDVMYGRPYDCHTPEEHVQQLRAVWRQRTVSSGNEWNQLDRQKEYYDRKIHGKPYDEGDLVWLCSPVVRKDRGRKLYLAWTRPYKIVRLISEVIYRIQHVSCRKRRIVIHFDRLKPCPSDIRLQLPETPCASSPSPPSTDSPRTKFNATLVSPEDPPAPSSSSRYPRRIHRKPDYYSPVFCSFTESGTYSHQRREQM